MSAPVRRSKEAKEWAAHTQTGDPHHGGASSDRGTKKRLRDRPESDLVDRRSSHCRISADGLTLGGATQAIEASAASRPGARRQRRLPSPDK